MSHNFILLYFINNLIVDGLECSVEHCGHLIHFYAMILQAFADLNRMLENHVAKLEDLQHQHQHTHPATATGGAAAVSTEHVTQ